MIDMDDVSGLCRFVGTVGGRPGASGTSNGAGGVGSLFGAFSEPFEDPIDLALAALEESSGVGVAVNRGAVGEAIFDGGFAGVTPVKEIALDGIAVGMAADAAKAAVAVEAAYREVRGGAQGATLARGSRLVRDS